MTAVLVPAASEAEWLAARRKGITASEIAVLMGLSPYSSPFALYHQKTGDLPGQDDNLAMALGRRLENFVAECFTGQRPELYVTGNGRHLYAHPERPWQMATPDRIVCERINNHMALRPLPDLLAVLECKTDNSHDGWGDDGSDEIPVHYRCQVLWQMDVLGVSTGFVACLFLHSRQFRVYELTMNDQAEADLTLMRCEAQIFRQRIANNRPPEVDWRPATADALRRIHPMLDPGVTMTIPASLTRWYRAACRDLKDAERRKALYSNRIRDILGTGRYANSPDGLPVARRDVYDVAAKTIERKAITVDKLVPITPKEPS